MAAPSYIHTEGGRRHSSSGSRGRRLLACRGNEGERRWPEAIASAMRWMPRNASRTGGAGVGDQIGALHLICAPPLNVTGGTGSARSRSSRGPDEALRFWSRGGSVARRADRAGVGGRRIGRGVRHRRRAPRRPAPSRSASAARRATTSVSTTARCRPSCAAPSRGRTAATTERSARALKEHPKRATAIEVRRLVPRQSACGTAAQIALIKAAGSCGLAIWGDPLNRSGKAADRYPLTKMKGSHARAIRRPGDRPESRSG